MPPWQHSKSVLTEWSELEPEDGVLTHTNHFLADPGSASDRMLLDWPDTVERLSELKSTVAASSGVFDIGSIKAAFAVARCPGRSRSAVTIPRI